MSTNIFDSEKTERGTDRIYLRFGQKAARKQAIEDMRLNVRTTLYKYGNNKYGKDTWDVGKNIVFNAHSVSKKYFVIE